MDRCEGGREWGGKEDEIVEEKEMNRRHKTRKDIRKGTEKRKMKTRRRRRRKI